MKYYQLTGGFDQYQKFTGALIRADHTSHEEWFFDARVNEWVPIGIMLNYFWPESPECGMYKELTEREAMQMIKNVG